MSVLDEMDFEKSKRRWLGHDLVDMLQALKDQDLEIRQLRARVLELENRAWKVPTWPSRRDLLAILADD